MKPKIKRDVNNAKMHFWFKFGNPNFNWLGSMARTTQNGVNFDLCVKFDHEGQGQSPHNTRILTKIFYSSGPNLVILGWTSDGLPHEQAQGSQAHTTHTDAGNNNSRRPKIGLRGNDKVMVIMIMVIILLIMKILIAFYVLIFMMITIVISCTDGMLSIFSGWQTWLQNKYKIQSKPQMVTHGSHKGVKIYFGP